MVKALKKIFVEFVICILCPCLGLMFLLLLRTLFFMIGLRMAFLSSMGSILMATLIGAPLCSVIGIYVADKLFLKIPEFSVLAAISAFVFSFIGGFSTAFLFDRIGGIISFVIFLFTVVSFSLAGYHISTWMLRWLKR